MFKVGSEYTKKDIYKLLEVPTEKQKGAWDTGYTRYNGDIFIFANIGVAGRTGHDYDNHWQGEDFVWYGKTGSNINQPLIQQMISGSGKIYIFTRIDDRSPFTFQGEGKATKTEDISPVKIIWTFKKSKLINPKEAWQILVRNAKAHMKFDGIYVSPVQKHQYKILEVDDSRIRIKRLSVDSQTEDDLTYTVFEGAITRINKSQGNLRRKNFYGQVLLEAAIVWLLPMLDWDDDFESVIIADEFQSSIVYSKNIKSLTDAEADTEIRTIQRQLRIRRGQNKLRENLFYLYESKCSITRYAVKDVLHACHIVPHSISGDNDTTNALLLRSDIHDLFDSNLIGIDPKSLSITTKRSLHNSEYSTLENIKVSERVDGKSLNKESLLYRWEVFNSLKTER